MVGGIKKPKLLLAAGLPHPVPQLGMTITRLESVKGTRQSNPIKGNAIAPLRRGKKIALICPPNEAEGGGEPKNQRAESRKRKTGKKRLSPKRTGFINGGLLQEGFNPKTLGGRQDPNTKENQGKRDTQSKSQTGF